MSKVLAEREDQVLVITINRPEVRNCVDGETATLLEEAWKTFRDDEDLYVAILTGAGDVAFCAGADLRNLQTLGPAPDATRHEKRRFITHGPGYMGYTRQVDIYKPIIAAVNGYALAGGLELSCLADIRIATENAQFGVACRRWNVPLLDGGTQRLPRIVGMGWAMEMIVTGRFIDAKEAYRIGLANEVVPQGQALKRAKELALQICKLPQGALRTDKQAALMGYGRPLEEGLRIEAEVGQTVLDSYDIIEGSSSFIQKRRPSFKQDS
ncbi:crotonase/enoyl-CoA hydratase family protein [Candidatus Poribacteria bacterium]|nr:crotonase/enoyl-CoA hydratase family protein [Candidatus Poribacteria bacterium]